MISLLILVPLLATASNGPTAHFLNKDTNLKLSCEVCEVAFKHFKTDLKKRSEEGDVEHDKVSAIVVKEMGKTCEKLMESYKLKWTPKGDTPLKYKLYSNSDVPSHHLGTEEQIKWTKQFIGHRCEFLKNKYSVEISIKFAEQELPSDVCPITDCEGGSKNKKDKETRKTNEEEITTREL